MSMSIVAGLLIPEKTDWRQHSENIYRICCRCHGGSFGVVFTDTCHGYV